MRVRSTVEVTYDLLTSTYSIEEEEVSLSRQRDAHLKIKKEYYGYSKRTTRNVTGVKKGRLLSKTRGMHL